MAARSPLAGIEVPIIGSDSIKWFHVSLPSTSTSTSISSSFAPPTEDASSCCNIGDPPTYFVWRINKTSSNILEIVEFCSFAEFPRVGLRIEFPNALCPFALICKNEFTSSSGNPYMLYTLTAAGVAYLIRLSDITNYASCSVFPPNEVVELNIQSYCNYGAITAISATAGCLIIGGSDGSVGCFRLGILDPSAPGFLHELRDDSSFGRLWNLMSRKNVAAVKGLLCLEIQEKKLLLVLHLDGVLRVWDLLSCSKLLSYTMNASSLEVTMSRSTAPTEYAADESSYMSNPVRRTLEPSEKYDPSEDSDAATDRSPTRSATPAPESSRQPTRGLRARATARMSVSLPVRRTFNIPLRDEAGPSRPRDRSVTPPLATETPIRRRTDMTPLESFWVTGMARDVETHRMRLHSHYQFIDGLMTVMNTNNEVLNKTMDIIVDLRRSIQRLYSYLVLLIGVLVVMLGWMVLWTRH